MSGATVQTNLPFVQGVQDRYGKWRYYFRRKAKRVPLPGKPGSLEFLRAYNEALSPTVPEAVERIDPRSFESLCRSYMASADHEQLSENWKRDMGYVIKALLREHGHKPVELLEQRHVVEMKNALKHKPGACNKMLRVLKIMLNYGISIGMRKDNPADKVKLMKLGRYRAWTDAELLTFEGKWEIGTLERFIFDTALYSGQRADDISKLKRTQLNFGSFRLIQGKTGKVMTVKIHARWQISMDAYLPTHNAPTLIAGREGKSIHKVTMSDIFREARRAAGLPEDCVLHGLRKTTARILAELKEKSTSVTGHITAAMQTEYERDANQEGLATAAILTWEQKRKV